MEEISIPGQRNTICKSSEVIGRITCSRYIGSPDGLEAEARRVDHLYGGLRDMQGSDFAVLCGNVEVLVFMPRTVKEATEVFREMM